MSFHRRLERKIVARLGVGFLVLIPLVITVVVLRFLFVWTEDLMAPVVENVLRQEDAPRGVGFVTFFVLLYLVGLVAASVLGRRIIEYGHNVMGSIPVVRGVYGVARQAVDALTVARGSGFKRVVIVEYPRKGVWSIGFVTGHLSDAEGRPMAVIYIATAPNPTSGYLAILPTDQCMPTELGVDEAMKMILSGGILVPPRLEPKTPEGVEMES